jgi:hypothetical protein
MPSASSRSRGGRGIGFVMGIHGMAFRICRLLSEPDAMLQGERCPIQPSVSRMTTRMTASEIEAYLDQVFPQLHYGGRTYFVEEVGPMTRAHALRLS